jgi:hypothetical protein
VLSVKKMVIIIGLLENSHVIYPVFGLSRVFVFIAEFTSI